ncbi:hypothetical protein [Nocardia sp. NPDC005366]|uniref:hypothetical protein n=1 Tax=Nocardia sp. NPDC005366 TaxID=3156878 RepID=UPI0033AAF9B8
MFVVVPLRVFAAGNQDKAVGWTIIGAGGALIALLFLVPIGKQKKSHRSIRARTANSVRRRGQTPQ